jgi:Leucine-rich repeat (LRR) protein
MHLPSVHQFTTNVLPPQLSCLQALRRLEVDNYSTAPPTLCSSLSYLERLELTCPELEAFPNICHLSCLTMLVIHESAIQEVPDYLSKLTQLEVLHIVWSKLCSCPLAIGLLPSLRELNLSGNEELAELPESLGSLMRLQSLNLSRCSSLVCLPQTITRLSQLQELSIVGCKSLQSVPVWPKPSPTILSLLPEEADC